MNYLGTFTSGRWEKVRWPSIGNCGDAARSRKFSAGKEKRAEPDIVRLDSRKKQQDRTSPTKRNVDISLTPTVTPFVVMISSPPVPEKHHIVLSEPCTPRCPLDGWNIPTSYSALEMRDVEEFVATESSRSLRPKKDVHDGEVPSIILPEVKEARTYESQTCASTLSGTTKEQAKPTAFRCVLASSPQRNGYERLRTKSVCDQKPLYARYSSGCDERQISPTGRKLKIESFDSRNNYLRRDVVSLSSAVHTATRGRKQSFHGDQVRSLFAQVWKSTMDAERRQAHEHAKLLADIKKKRQIQREKLRTAAELKERERAFREERLASLTHPDKVESVISDKENVIKRNRSLEKRRFADALRAIRIEKSRGYGLQVPPVCDCGHGEDPLHPEYIRKCSKQCRLRDNFTAYTTA